LQNWLNALEAQKRRAAADSSGSSGSSGSNAFDLQLAIARAIYICELTRREPRWGDWVEQNDNSLASPQVGLGLRV